MAYTRRKNINAYFMDTNNLVTNKGWGGGGGWRWAKWGRGTLAKYLKENSV